jgi:hypothetical protein
VCSSDLKAKTTEEMLLRSTKDRFTGGEDGGC